MQRYCTNIDFSVRAALYHLTPILNRKGEETLKVIIATVVMPRSVETEVDITSLRAVMTSIPSVYDLIIGFFQL